MKVTFWGTRGSIPSPGPDTAKFGGNTTCIEVQAKDRDPVVIDMGTGARALGQSLVQRPNAPQTIPILFTHFHWDHIQGFPFFAPTYMEGKTLEIFGAGDAESILKMQMTQPMFPVGWEVTGSRKLFHRIDQSGFELNGLEIQAIRLYHPQNVFGFRFTDGRGKSFTLCTDLETQNEIRDEEVIRFVKGTDLLAYDAQYSNEEYANGKKGWGHSTYEDACRIAKAAGVGRLGLFHHDPLRTDEKLLDFEQKARRLFEGAFACADEMTVEL